MSLKSDKELATNSSFLTQIEMAMLNAANNIAGETPASPANTSLDDKRHALTQNVYVGKDTWLVTFAHACAAMGTLSTASTDSDVQNSVNAIWNDLAGVTGAEV